MARGSITEAEAVEAAARLDRARAAGDQLALFGQQASGPDGARRTRGLGKASSQLRAWLAHQGYTQPEEALARRAGLAAGGDPVLAAMTDAERILAWAYDQPEREGVTPKAPTPAIRLDVLTMCLSEQRRAAEALLPYGLAKITPDAAPAMPVQVNVFGGAGPAAAQPGQGPDQARDVTPRPARLAPPPMPKEIVQDQALAQAVADHADGAARTEGASR